MAQTGIVGEGVLGKSVEGTRRKLDPIELLPSVKFIRYESDEIFSHCPQTGQPDFYTAKIEVTDPAYGVESKSLKLFLQSFEDKEACQFCEEFADTIATEVHHATKAWQTRVELVQKPRGGITISAVSTHRREKG